MPKQRNRPGQTIPDTQPFNPTAQHHSPTTTKAGSTPAFSDSIPPQYRATPLQPFPTIKISTPKHLSAHATIPQLAPGTHQGHPAPRQRH